MQVSGQQAKQPKGETGAGQKPSARFFREIVQFGKEHPLETALILAMMAGAGRTAIAQEGKAAQEEKRGNKYSLVHNASGGNMPGQGMKTYSPPADKTASVTDYFSLFKSGTISTEGGNVTGPFLGWDRREILPNISVTATRGDTVFSVEDFRLKRNSGTPTIPDLWFTTQGDSLYKRADAGSVKISGQLVVGPVRTERVESTQGGSFVDLTTTFMTFNSEIANMTYTRGGVQETTTEVILAATSSGLKAWAKKNGQWLLTDQGSVQVDVHERTTGVKDEGNAFLPNKIKLEQNYPNPFNPTTTIPFKLPNNADVTIKVYDIKGSVVATLADNQPHAPGNHYVTFDGSHLPSGIYFASLNANGQIIGTVKMALVK